MKSTSQNSNLTILNLFQALRYFWKFLAIGAILGGMGGMLASALLSPRYEAVAVFTFSIDFARTGLLTDVEEDQAFEAAGDIVRSTRVLQSLEEKAQETGLTGGQKDLLKSLTAERRFDQWLLKVIWSDPETAARLANLWGSETLNALQNARQAAWKADALHRHILSLETCLQQSTSVVPAQPLCQASSRSALLREMQDSGEEMNRWQMEAQGFFPGLNFAFAQEAASPASPVQYSRGVLVLAGCLAGLLIAALAALFVVKI